MTVTDDARAVAIWQKLQEAQLRLNEATKIMSYMFEVDETGPVTSCEIRVPTSEDVGPIDERTGLYPGQKVNPEDLIKYEDEDAEICEE